MSDYVDNIIQLIWNPSSFLDLSTTAASAFRPVSASHVSTHNLTVSCPPSLLKALHEDFVDQSVVRNSYYKKKKQPPGEQHLR